MGQFSESGEDAPSQNARFRRERQCGRSIRVWPGPVLIPRFSLDIYRVYQFKSVRDGEVCVVCRLNKVDGNDTLGISKILLRPLLNLKLNTRTIA